MKLLNGCVLLSSQRRLKELLSNSDGHCFWFLNSRGKADLRYVFFSLDELGSASGNIPTKEFFSWFPLAINVSCNCAVENALFS